MHYNTETHYINTNKIGKSGGKNTQNPTRLLWSKKNEMCKLQKKIKWESFQSKSM